MRESLNGLLLAKLLMKCVNEDKASWKYRWWVVAWFLVWKIATGKYLWLHVINTRKTR